MNWFPALLIRLPARCRPCFIVASLLAGGCAVALPQDSPPQSPESPERVYDLAYTVRPVVGRGTAEVELHVAQVRRFLREMSMDMPAERFSGLAGDGEIRRDGDRVHWLPARTGGTLRWTVRFENERNGAGFDARLARDWALFRASDVIPPAATRTVKNARSRTTLAFDLPRGWSSLTEFPERGGRYRISNPDRRFDRPTGWILLGDIGVRIETIGTTRVLIGGPTGQDVRRMDMLALLNWTLPELQRVLPAFPRRLTIVSAADGMWRGGLSAPGSIYLHAGLPLISENATSTLLHEVLHVGLGMRGGHGADWVVEGLAEYYSLELMRRSGTITPARYREAIEGLRKWAASTDKLCRPASTGPTTALAVTVFDQLARELARVTGEDNALDELVRRLLAEGETVTVPRLRRTAAELAGRPLESLAGARLPGCPGS